MAGASGSSSGAIPKKTTPPAAENSGNFNRVDYAELSRLLSTHIDAQNQTTPTAPVQTESNKQSAEAEAAEKDAAKSTKTPPPTPSHPGLYFFSNFHPPFDLIISYQLTFGVEIRVYIQLFIQ